MRRDTPAAPADAVRAQTACPARVASGAVPSAPEPHGWGVTPAPGVHDSTVLRALRPCPADTRTAGQH
jgi:hypothetical protein